MTLIEVSPVVVAAKQPEAEVERSECPEEMENDTMTTVVEELSKPQPPEVESDDESVLSFGDGPPRSPKGSPKTKPSNLSSSSSSDAEVRRPIVRLNRLDSDASSNDEIRRPTTTRVPLDSDEESLLSLDKNYPTESKRPTLLNSSDSGKSKSSRSQKSDLAHGGQSESKQKVVKRMTKKQRDDVMKEIKSKTERLKREAPLKLPYHRPEVPSLNEFLERRNKAKAEFQNSLGPKFKLKGFGGLGNKLEDDFFKFDCSEKETTATPEPQKSMEEDEAPPHPLQEIEKEIPFSSKVDEWMKNFESENNKETAASASTVGEMVMDEEIVMDVDTENAVVTNTNSNTPQAAPTEGTAIELSTVKLQKIYLTDSDIDDSDDGLIIDEDNNVELVDLADTSEANKIVENPFPSVVPETVAIQESSPADGQGHGQVDEPMQGTSKNMNPQPNRFEVLDAELNEYYDKMCEETQVKKPPTQRRTIADLLRSQPNHEELLKIKPKIGDAPKSGFIDLDPKPKKPSNHQRQMQILMDRFVKHTAVQKKPKEQHFTVHVSKKEEDSQGKEKITVNEIDYVQVASHLVDDNDVTETASPSPNRRQVVPGARFVKLRESLRSQIQEKKKREYVEKMKRHAIDNEENYVEEGKEEEEEIIGDDDMTESESEPEVTDDEELENIRRKEKKNRKKKSAFVEDEAEDDEDEENKNNVEGDDDETDDETCDDPSEVEIEDDLISIKSSDIATAGGEKKFQRVIKIVDSSDEDENEKNESGEVEAKDIVFDDDLGDFEAKDTEDSIIKQFVEISDRKAQEVPVKNSDELIMDESQNSRLDTNELSHKSSEMFKSLDLDDNRNSQDMFAENSYNTDGLSPSFSNDDRWTTPTRTPLEIESLFSSQMTQTQTQGLPFKFSGQVDSQRPETPSPETWAMPTFRGGRPGWRPSLAGLNNSPHLFVSPTSSLTKVNSELALDYFLEDNTPSELTPTAIPIPREITKLFDNVDGNGFSFGKSPSGPNNDEDDLLDICSGKFPTQAPATPEESQSQDISELDEDEAAVNSAPVDAGATVTPVSSRRFQTDNETPRMSEKVMKTTRLFQEIEKNNADVAEDDDDEDKSSVVSGFKMVKKRKRRLEFSDEEDDEDDADSEPEPEPEDEYEEEKIEPEYDDEEEEIIKKPVFKGMVSTRTGRIRKEFVDAEAELSGSEVGSGDEDERGLDYLDEEEGDAEKIDEDQLRDEVGKAHFKQMLDDDQRQVRLLQEAYLEHGDLHTDGKTRERQFRWKNIDENMNNDDMNMDDEEKVVVIDEAEIQRQKDRIDKVKWMKENSHLMESDDDEDEGTQNFLEDSQFLKIRKSTFAKIQSSVLHSDTSMSMPMTSASKLASRMASFANMDKTDSPDYTGQDAHNDCINPKPKVTNSQQFFPSPEDPFSKIRRGSFLSRGSPTLSRLAEMTKINDTVSNVKSNSRNFVFAVVTPPENKSDGNHAASRKQTNPARRSIVQPKKIMKIDRSFSSMDTTRKEASIFGWFK